MVLKKIAFLLFTFLFTSLLGKAQNLFDTTDLPPKYEMRGAWVSTVGNIDWPSKKNLTPDQQRAEFVQIIANLKAIGLNAVFVQVRPAGDAFYPSEYDPWSEYLTGKQGQAPVPFYDPLKFMIEETHRQGLEFHAWINPYRMVMDVSRSSVAESHVTKLHPDWFVHYGKQMIFNPGIPEAVKYITGVVRDIVNRYDVDGIHMDDYFYPYQEHGAFHDENAYQKYGNGMSLADWRRSNCNNLIESIHNAIVADNPMVKFGVSPFGIYRNKSSLYVDGSNTSGSQAYDELYADILLWLKNGWVDYIAPQLYWEIGHARADYATLLNWWSSHMYGKQLYIGEGIYRANEASMRSVWRGTTEFPKHIQMERALGNKVQGEILFSTKDILKNPNGWADSLSLHYYRKPAIVPPMDWIDKNQPEAPEIWVEQQSNGLMVNAILDAMSKEEVVKSYILYTSVNPATLGNSPDFIQPSTTQNAKVFIPWESIPVGCSKFYIGMTTLDRENNESDLSNFLIATRVSGNTWNVNLGKE